MPLDRFQVPAIILRPQAVYDPLEDRTDDYTYVADPTPIKVLRSQSGTSEDWSKEGNIISRQIRVMYFGNRVLTQDDRLVINGETFIIDGFVQTYKTFMTETGKVTTLLLTKTGEGLL